MSAIAAKLRHRAIIQTMSETFNASGGATRAYTDVATVYCGMEAVSERGQAFVMLLGAESVGDAKTSTHKIITRYNSNVVKDRFFFVKTNDAGAGRRFKIIGVRDVDERHEYQEASCREQEVA